MTLDSIFVELLPCLFDLLFNYIDFLIHLFQEEFKIKHDTANYADEVAGPRLIAVQKKESILAKSFDKLKETSTVWIFTTLH